VELRGLEPLTPCLQIAEIAQVVRLSWAGYCPPVTAAYRR
jgi:hypothetical protein